MSERIKQERDKPHSPEGFKVVSAKTNGNLSQEQKAEDKDMKVVRTEEQIRAEVEKVTGAMSDESLFDSWEMSGKVSNPDAPTIRGWLMDEIEKRFPEAFDRWLDQDVPEDNELRTYCLG